jgi:surface antigen
MLAVSLALGGCSYRLDSMLGKSKGDGEIAGSLGPRVTERSPDLPPEADLALARAAVSEVLASGVKDTAVPWENPSTGARGTITPIAATYSQDGLTCHDFLASFVRSGSESWMLGEACLRRQGKWEVRNLKPWQRT